MASKRFSNVIGFDDAPFAPDYAGPVPVVGAVFTSLQVTGVVIGQVEKDGADSAAQLVRLVRESRFAEHVQLILLQGIALAGFNVVDVFYLYQQLEMPVLVVSRKMPDLPAVKNALLTQIANGDQKWRVIEQLGPLEAAGNVYIQRVGLTAQQAQTVIKRFAIYSHIPEPLRLAHLIAGAIINGQSRGRP